MDKLSPAPRSQVRTGLREQRLNEACVKPLTRAPHANAMPEGCCRGLYTVEDVELYSCRAVEL